MSTIHEVANAAGVSTATVSRVINDPRSVRDSTRQRVMEVIQRMNYQPNSNGRGLRLNKANAILVIVPDITNPFFSKVVRSIEANSWRHGYNVLLFESFVHEQSGSALRKFVISKKTDGAIFLSTKANLDEIKMVSKHCTTVLGCEYLDCPGIPSVSIDNVEASIDIVNHLIDLGHRDILFIGGTADILSSRDRWKGYVLAHQDRGLEVRDELRVECSTVWDGASEVELGYSAVEKAIQRDLRFTSVFCTDDLVAVGAMRAIQAHGLHIPNDISLVGFDDIPFAKWTNPPLTTVSQDCEEIGRKVVELWMDLHRGAPAEYPIKISHHLVVRGSTGRVSDCYGPPIAETTSPRTAV